MSISRLPSGRWRCQIRDPETGKNISVAKLLNHQQGSYETKREAKAAREEARRRLGLRTRTAVTVAQFRSRWLSDPLFERPKQSTMIYNAERTRKFAEMFGDVPISEIGDDHVSRYLQAPKRANAVPALKAMFNDAASVQGGRLVQTNPFAGLKLAKTRGNRDVNPPDEKTVWKLIEAAREKTTPSFAAWLQVACFTGMRPGELDALRWTRVDWDRNRILVVEQFSAASCTFTSPKNGLGREAILTGHARDALEGLPRDSEFCFVNLYRGHFQKQSRNRLWNMARKEAGYSGTLYVSTRHFFGWYATNVLGVLSEDLAYALGHTDGGALVRSLYGHRDRNLALDRVAEAFEGRSNVVPLRAMEG